MKKLLLVFTLFLLSSFVCNGQSFYTLKHNLCPGDSTGSIEIDTNYAFAWGSPPFSYQLFPTYFSTLTTGPLQNGRFNNLQTGTYSIIVSDANNTDSTYLVAISQPADFYISNDYVSRPSCPGDSVGNVEFEVNGGTPPYIFNPSGNYYSPPSYSKNLNIGIHSITITDSNGCMIIHNTEIYPPHNLLSSVYGINYTCGDSSGQISVTISPYGASVYTWPYLTPTAAGYYENVPAGNYTIVGVDSLAGCRDSLFFSVYNTTPYLSNLITIPPTTCMGGSVSFTTNGSSNYPVYFDLFNIGNSTWVASGSKNDSSLVNINNLDPGNYQLYLFAGTCLLDTLITISGNSFFQFNQIGNTNLACNGDNTGGINVSTINGTSPITYSILSLDSNTTGVFSSLAASTYILRAIDSTGCMIDSTIVLTEPPPLQITNVTSTIPSCVPGCDGSVTLTASGGTGGLQYNLNNMFPQASGVFTNVCAGASIASVIDQNGCVAYTTAIVPTPGAPIINNIVVNNVSCNGGADGSIQFFANPGTAAPITYHIFSPIVTNSSAGQFNNLAAGTYTIGVTDANGCVVQTIANIFEPAALVIDTISVSHSSCNQSNGSISVASIGGTGTNSYTINTTPPSSNVTGVFNNLTAGTYTIIVTDANGCTSSTLVHLSNFGNIASSNISVTDVLCFGDSSGTIVVNSNNQTIYSIAPNLGIQTSVGTFINLPAATYTITATDINNCSGSATATIVQPQPLSINNLHVTNVKCNGQSNGSIFLNANGGIGTKYYTIQPGGIATNTGQFHNLGAGQYHIGVTDVNNCMISTTATISEPSPLNLVAALSGFGPGSARPPSCVPGNDGSIYPLATGGVVPMQFYSNNNIINNASYFNLDSGIYYLKVVDHNQCVATKTIKLTPHFPRIDSFQIRPKICKYLNGGSIGIYYETEGGIASSLLTEISSGTQPEAWHSLDSGFYAVELTNSFGCTTQDTAYLPFELLNFQLDNAIIKEQSCDEIIDGRITFSGEHQPPFSYSIAPIVGLQANERTFSGLRKGNYILTGEDSLGCIGTDTVEVGVLDNREFFYSTNKASNVHCYGSINAEAIGGVGAYTYSISPRAGRQESAGYFDGLCWGNYTLTATDSAGCIISEKISILEDPNAPRNMFHHMIVYPNPAQNEIWIKSNYLMEYKASLINATGQCVYTNNFHDKLVNIPVGHLTPGLYILRFKSDVDHYERKLIIR